LFSCAKCGACAVVCPVFRVSGKESHTARGKLHLIETLGLAESSKVFVDIFSACLLCGACSAVCSRKIDITKELVAARNTFSSLAGPHAYEKYITRKLLDYPGGLTGFRVLGRTGEKLLGDRLPGNSGLRKRLALFRGEFPVEAFEEQPRQVAPDAKRLTWFPGCASRYLFPEILASCRSLLADVSVSLDIPEGLSCCGLADWAAGDREGAENNSLKNIEALEATEGAILVSCASCFAHLKKYPDLFAENTDLRIRAERVAARVVELSDFLEGLGEQKQYKDDEKSRQLRVFYHDPCHMRHEPATTDKAREQLQRVPGIQIVELADGPRCCGQGGLFNVAHPEISANIIDQLVQDVLALGPDVVTSTCSGCLMQWKQGLAAAGSKVQVLHLAQLLK